MTGASYVEPVGGTGHCHALAVTDVSRLAKRPQSGVILDPEDSAQIMSERGEQDITSLEDRWHGTARELRIRLPWLCGCEYP